MYFKTEFSIKLEGVITGTDFLVVNNNSIFLRELVYHLSVKVEFVNKLLDHKFRVN